MSQFYLNSNASGLPSLDTINHITPDALNNFTIAAGTGIVITPGTNEITISMPPTTQYAVQVGNASGSLTSLTPANNGQLVIGSTGNNPSVAALTALPGISITNGAGSIQIGADGTVATTFQANSGHAMPSNNTVSILGGTNITTAASASILTISLNGTVAVANGGTGVTSVTTSPTATAFAGWDSNKNMSANAVIEGYATTATAAATTTLTVSSAELQFFTGTTTQTVLLPVTSTLVLGQKFKIFNNCSNGAGILTIQSSGANLLQLLPPLTYGVFTCINTGVTTASGWFVQSFNSDPSTPIGDTSGGSLGIGALTNGGTTPATGSQNTSIGYQAGGSLTSGTTSVYVGYRCGVATTTGGNNVYVGYNTGSAAQNGSNNTFIGYEANGSTTSAGGCIAIGINAQAQTSTGSTSLTDGPGIAFGSTTAYPGFRGDGVPYSSNAGAGYWRARIGSTTAYYLPLFVDRTSQASGVMTTDASGAPIVTTSLPAGTTQTAIITAPVSSATATTAWATSLTAGTSVHNTSGYDLLINVVYTVTAATTATITMGVGSATGPTQQTVIPSFSTAASTVYSFSAYVPTSYYFVTNTTGTITVGSITTMAMAI